MEVLTDFLKVNFDEENAKGDDTIDRLDFACEQALVKWKEDLMRVHHTWEPFPISVSVSADFTIQRAALVIVYEPNPVIHEMSD